MKRQRLNTYGSSKRGVFLNNDVRLSDAYRALSATQRLILIDMIYRYNAKSGGDTANIRDIGFTYCYNDCSEIVDALTFRRARQELVAKGFFTLAHDLKGLKPGGLNVYRPSTDWKRYKLTETETARIAKATRRRKDTLARDKQRRRDHAQKKRAKNEAI